MEEAFGDITGKMGYGMLRYTEHDIVCVIDSKAAGKEARKELGLSGKSCPIVASVDEAKQLGANVLVLGIAPLGGEIPTDWFAALDHAVELGMCLVNGLHQFLTDRYQILGAGQWIWDIRREPNGLSSGKGLARQLKNRRVLFVGTDMAVGKMTAGIELYREAKKHNISTGFVATGQIGISIFGSGVPLDAVRIDFASGSVEREVMRHQNCDLILIEGQGSLVHPGSSATLPLLRGSCPTHIVMCHRAGQSHLYRAPDIVIPPLRELAELYEKLGSVLGTFGFPKTVAVALNTSECSPTEADEVCAKVEQETGLPCCDPVRNGASKLLDAILNAP